MDLYSLIEVVQKTENLLATEELLKRTKELIYKILVKKSVPNNCFCDLAQECLIRVASSIKTLKKKENFRMWINQIVNNIFYDYLRKKQRNPEYTSLDAECVPLIEDKSPKPYEKYKNKRTCRIYVQCDGFLCCVLCRRILSLLFGQV